MNENEVKQLTSIDGMEDYEPGHWEWFATSAPIDILSIVELSFDSDPTLDALMLQYYKAEAAVSEELSRQFALPDKERYEQCAIEDSILGRYASKDAEQVAFFKAHPEYATRTKPELDAVYFRLIDERHRAADAVKEWVRDHIDELVIMRKASE